MEEAITKTKEEPIRESFSYLCTRPPKPIDVSQIYTPPEESREGKKGKREEKAKARRREMPGSQPALEEMGRVPATTSIQHSTPTSPDHPLP